MTTNSSFDSTAQGSQEPKKDHKNLIIAILSIALVAVSIYAIVNNNKKGDTIAQQQAAITQTTNEKAELQKSFDESLTRLDSVKSVNSGLESKLTESTSEIAKTKEQIRAILNKKNATAAELTKAKELIADLNTKIAGMEQEVVRLTKENQGLTQDKAALTQDKEKLTQDLTATQSAKEELAKKVDIASTLNASNINLTPVNVKGNGKEKVTSTAKRVDKLVISFDVDNRIIQSGSTDVYICVLGPDGKAITSEKSGAATFSTREEGDKAYTAKVPVDLETAKKKNIQFAFVPEQSFQQGTYTIQIYQNGFKIGESKRDLKKGGLF